MLKKGKFRDIHAPAMLVAWIDGFKGRLTKNSAHGYFNDFETRFAISTFGCINSFHRFLNKVAWPHQPHYYKESVGLLSFSAGQGSGLPEGSEKKRRAHTCYSKNPKAHE